MDIKIEEEVIDMSEEEKKELEEVRIGYEQRGVAAFFNASSPALKAAKQTTKEFATQKVDKEMRLEKAVEEINRITQ